MLSLHGLDYIRADTAKLGECEFFLISEIDAQLVVHHPYRSLTELQTTLALSQDDIQLAWSVVNDHYVTDLALIHPPHVIATMAIILTVVIKGGSAMQMANSAMNLSQAALQPASTSVGQAAQSKSQRLLEWLTQSGVDVEAVVECTQEMISLYVVLEQFSERDCKEAFSRIIRHQGLNG